MTKVELYAIGTSTPLESNKSLGALRQCYHAPRGTTKHVNEAHEAEIYQAAAIHAHRHYRTYCTASPGPSVHRQLRALTKVLALRNKASQIEAFLAPYEPGYRREDEPYDHDGRAIGEEIGVHTQREARKQHYELLLLLAIEEVPRTDGAKEDGHHQGAPNIHRVSPPDDGRA